VASRARLAALAVAGAALIALPGCGTEVEPPEPRVAETVHRVPDLPAGWRAHVNTAGGYAFGLPRGWRASDHGARTEVRSYDRLVAITINADRTDEAIALDPAEFAAAALAAAPGYEEPLAPGPPREFEHRYEGSQVTAGGTAKATGLKLDVSEIALRRDETAVLTALIAANARPQARGSRRLAERVIGTLRSRPVEGAAP
jgi:hypothetical protein